MFAFNFVCGDGQNLNLSVCHKIVNKRNEKQMNNDELLEFVEDSRQSLYVVKNGFFVKTDEKWEKVRYVEILWVRAFETCC